MTCLCNNITHSRSNHFYHNSPSASQCHKRASSTESTLEVGRLSWFKHEKGMVLLAFFRLIFALKKASASDRNASKIANSQSWYLENHPILGIYPCSSKHSYSTQNGPTLHKILQQGRGGGQLLLLCNSSYHTWSS